MVSSIRHSLACLLQAALACALLQVPSFPQTTNAQLTGIITDQTGAPVPLALVTATNEQTGIRRETQSNESGNYAIPLLPPGAYTITVRREGFRTITRTAVELQVAQVARVDFGLEVGSVTQTTEVTAQAPLLDQSSASLGQVIGSKQILDLPLNGRSTFRLVQLTPGVTGVPSTNGQFSDIPVNTMDDSIIRFTTG